MQVTEYAISLAIDRIAGGFPGNIDAYRAYLQNPALRKAVAPEVRHAFEEQMIDAGLPEQGKADTIVRTGFAMLEGQPTIFNYQLKAMLQEAAKAIYDNRSRPSIYQVSPAITYGLEIVPAQIFIQGGRIREEKVTISQIIKHPRNPDIKVPSVRERTICDGGTLAFTAFVLHQGRAKVLGAPKAEEDQDARIESHRDGPTNTVVSSPLNPSLPAHTVLQDLFEAGSMFVGLGTDRGYGHGRFRIANFEVVGKRDIALVQMGSMVDNPRRKGAGYVRADRREPKT